LSVSDLCSDKWIANGSIDQTSASGFSSISGVD